MKNKFYFFKIFLVLAITFLFNCNNQKSPFEVTNSTKSLPLSMEKGNSADIINASVPDCFIETELWAGAVQNDPNKGTLLGNVIAFAWGDYIYVKYHISKDKCYLVDVNTYVSDKKPLTAKPGQFIYKMKFGNPYPTSYLLQIPWKEKGWQCEAVLYIAANAIVAGVDKNYEIAWAYGNYSFINEGISNKWGWFFDLMLCCQGD